MSAGRIRPLGCLLLLAVLLGTPQAVGALQMEAFEDGQEGRVGCALSMPYRVVVTDSTGEPAVGLTTLFRIEGRQEGARLTTTVAQTDAQGSASTCLVLGKEMGDYTVRARVDGPGGEILEYAFGATAVDWRRVLFWIIGGLGLFLFGMQQMSEGLQKAAGDRMKLILGKLSKNRILGIGTGALVTGIIQSSSAMTVMVVGFVNAGLLSLKQAVSLVMGANIGTTVTGQIVAFPVQEYALPIIGIGVALQLFSRSRTVKLWGQVLSGLGILFLGLSTMTGAVKPLRTSQTIREFFITFSREPWQGVLAGTVVTMIVQSSSATVALTMALAGAGVIDVGGAVSLILGDNIGTTITAQIAAIGTSRPAKEAAQAHSLFNIFGVTYMLLGIYLIKVGGVPLYYRLVDALTKGSLSVSGADLMFVDGNVQRYIANAHTVFNVVNTIVFVPMMGLLVKAAQFLTPGKEEDRAEPKYLEEHLLAQPAIALGQATKEIVRMSAKALEAVALGTRAFLDGDRKLFEEVQSRERAVDAMQHDITKYLVALSQQTLDDKTAQALPVLLHTVNDVERIGDHAVNIVELAERRRGRKLALTDKALDELKDMHRVVDEMAAATMSALEHKDKPAATEALKYEEQLNRLQRKLRKNHVARLEKGRCDVLAGIVFIDMVDNYEKIGDHLTNIAQGVQGGLRWDADTGE